MKPNYPLVTVLTALFFTALTTNLPAPQRKRPSEQWWLDIHQISALIEKVSRPPLVPTPEQQLKEITDSIAEGAQVAKDRIDKSVADGLTSSILAYDIKRFITESTEVQKGLATAASNQNSLAQELAKRETDLVQRTKDLELDKAILRTGFFGCLATCLVGMVTIISTSYLGRHDRRLRKLEVLKLERELRETEQVPAPSARVDEGR